MYNIHSFLAIPTWELIGREKKGQTEDRTRDFLILEGALSRHGGVIVSEEGHEVNQDRRSILRALPGVQASLELEFIDALCRQT